ncbi:SpoIIE family protein phosphatase [Actinosynnema sp. NPDC020468]|uniref:SpoIIE family protein phosphatase n=1 Tax=Actinosynnema sp. NPDC020468 TaxID=3154488 RepID=UPI0033E72477
MRSPVPGGLVFPGNGEMAARMRAYPWSETSVGDPATWPAGLATATRICLTSRFPMIVWWGEELSFLYNDAYLPLLGTNHPALAKPGREVWSEIWHIIGPMLRSVMETGEATWSEDLLLPLVRHGYLEETYWTYSYSPLHDDDGVVRGVFTAVSDTTERVLGERRLAVLRDLGALAGSARTVDEACRLVAEALGRAGADVPFAAVHLRRPGTDDLVLASATTDDPDARAREWPLREVLTTDRLQVVEGFGPLPGGSWDAPPTQAVVLPLRGEIGGQNIGVVVLAASAGRMLDEAYHSFLSLVAQQTAALVNAAVAYQVQQRRAEELAELDRAKTTFFSNISHEFRTPLALILGPTEELRAGLADADPRLREELEVIHRNGLRLGKLVNTLLDFSRIEAGRMRASYEPVDLAVHTAELAGVFRSAIEKAGLAFEVDCPPLPAPVQVDRGMWEKVVFNLLSNALKFTFDGGVRVRLRADGDHAVVEVSDTGIGVPASEMPRLFERFHRIESGRSRSNEGSGIGLALVRELVLLHGGEITADSAEGRGTTFTIRVPFGVAHLPAEHLAPAGSTTAPSGANPFLQEALRWLPAEPDQQAPPAAAPPTGGPARVLIADDNADMREYLERLLRPFYEVTAVPDGEDALASARTAPPDLIVSDVMMPRLDGLQLVAALRADPRTAGVPVLLLSARAGQEASIEGLEAGADDYLVKPFAAAELLARVRANVELARLRNHHARWRTALIESLQEGFFVCAEDGSVIEVNGAFGRMLGYGPEGLPYHQPAPWWPAEADAREHIARMLDRTLTEAGGTYTTPVTTRDGRRLWLATSFNHVRDPDTKHTVIVGTVRDVTAEHFAVQRETAVGAVSVRLAGAANLTEALAGAAEELRDVWHARRVLTAVWGDSDVPTLTSTDPAITWATLPPSIRDTLTALRESPLLIPVGDAGIALDHPEGRVALWLDLSEHRPFAQEDRTLLALLGGHLGQGLHRIHQVDQQRKTALALQHAILGPFHLPTGFAVRYEPAARPLEVGGDWYDTVALADGRIGIVVGDCVGHGLDAAAVMGQLRSACRALLLQDNGPARTLMALDVFAATLSGARCTTVFCGVLNPDTGELVYSSAGHPPGILSLPDGARELLEDGRSLPLAVRVGAHRPEATRVVPPRATILLYTDGLVERRRRSLVTGIDQAAQAVTEGSGVPVDDLATDLMSSLAPPGGYEDDVALLLYRHPAPLEMSFTAAAAHLAPVRHALRDWLTRCDLPDPQAQAVLVAAGEACSNAVEHGHRDTPGRTVTLSALVTVDDLRVTVVDTGSWKPPTGTDDDHRGRGLLLMRELMDDVSVVTEPTGTTVDLHTRISPR